MPAATRKRGHAPLARMLAPVALLLGLLSPVGGAAAQPQPMSPSHGDTSGGGEAAPSAAAAPAGYERELLRLSEVMGALAFLRTLCGAGDATQWRERMAVLMDNEARDDETKARIAGAFNQGYRAFAVTYRTCTTAAEEAVTRYLAEGERLTKAIAGRFGE